MGTQGAIASESPPTLTACCVAVVAVRANESAFLVVALLAVVAAVARRSCSPREGLRQLGRPQDLQVALDELLLRFARQEG